MGEILGEMILELFGRIILKIISEVFIVIGGISLDAPLKLMGLPISWGFCYKKHGFAAILNTVLLFLIPIHIYNFGLTNGLYVYLGIFGAIVFILYFTNFDFKPVRGLSDLLDDDLP